MNVKGTPEPLETLARKLLGYKNVPLAEKKRMIRRCIKHLQEVLNKLEEENK